MYITCKLPWLYHLPITWTILSVQTPHSTRLSCCVGMLGLLWCVCVRVCVCVCCALSVELGDVRTVVTFQRQMLSGQDIGGLNQCSCPSLVLISLKYTWAPVSHHYYSKTLLGLIPPPLCPSCQQPHVNLRDVGQCRICQALAQSPAR